MIRGCENWASMDSEANNENLTLSFLRLQLSKRAEAGWLLRLASENSASSLQMSWRKLQRTLGKVSVRAAHFTVHSFCRRLTGYINLSRQPGRWDFKPEFSQICLAKYSRTSRCHLGRRRRKLWSSWQKTGSYCKVANTGAWKLQWRRMTVQTNPSSSEDVTTVAS